MFRMIRFVLALFLTSCSSTPQFEKSNHYNGKKFVNPGAAESEGLWSMMKLMYSMATSASWEGARLTEKPDLTKALKKDQVAVTFVNHASFLIQSPQGNVLTDPVWSERVSPFSWVGPKRYRSPGVEFEQLPKIDLVILSHNHYDHMDVATLTKINQKFAPLFLVPLGDKKHLEEIGITNVRELDWWQSVDLPSGAKVTFTPSQHFSSRGLFDRDHSLWGSYLLNVSGKKIFFGGDTGYSPHFKEIEAKLGAPDIALLPIGAYEPYWFMKRVHMNPEDATNAHLDLKSAQSLAMHFGTFKLTTEAIDEPEKALGRALDAKKIERAKFTVPIEGRTVVY